MKTSHPLLLAAGLVIAAGFIPSLHAAAKTATDNVTVIYQDPDKFTDVRENHSNTTSQYYLDELKACLQETAAPLLPAGQKLVITVTDIDLAGENQLGSPDNIRVIKDIYIPRAALSFRLLNAEGKVVREGARKLSDIDFNLKIRLPGSEEPLYYDKQLLKEWVRREFKPNA